MCAPRWLQTSGQRYHNDHCEMKQGTDLESAFETQLMICPSGSVVDEQSRFIEPSTGKAWLFDHLRLTASDPLDIQVDTECERIRTELQKAASSYGKEHFTEGVSKVFTSEQRKLKPKPKPKIEAPETAPAAVTSEQPKDIDTEMQAEDQPAESSETKTDSELVDPETEAPAGEGSTAAAVDDGIISEQPLKEQKNDEIDTDMVAKADSTDEVEPRKDATMETDTPDEETTQASEVAVTGLEASEQKADNQEETQEEVPAQPLPKRFSLYFVGNKYNPSNYW